MSITIEELMEDALAVAKIRQISHDDAIAALIVHHGRANVLGLEKRTNTFDEDKTVRLGSPLASRSDA